MAHAEEIWQGYDNLGNPTVGITRAEAAQGVLHGASHLWLWRKVNGDIKILLQKRASDKKLGPATMIFRLPAISTLVKLLCGLC